jgi:ABC-2 type transport system permease protein
VKVFRDIWLVFQRHLLLMIRTPLLVVLGIAQPVVYLILFAPLLKQALQPLAAPGQELSMTGAYQFYVPGMLIALSMATGLYAGFSLLGELSSGVIERARVTAISRSSLLIGRALRDVVVIIVQSILLTILSIPLGLIVSIQAILIAYLLLGMISLFTSAISYGIALKVSGPAVLGQIINNVAQPLMLISGTLLPIALAPLWIRNVAEWNPFAWAVDAMRSMFRGNLSDDRIWQSLLMVTILTVIAVAFSTRQFAKATK